MKVSTKDKQINFCVAILNRVRTLSGRGEEFAPDRAVEYLLETWEETHPDDPISIADIHHRQQDPYAKDGKWFNPTSYDPRDNAVCSALKREKVDRAEKLGSVSHTSNDYCVPLAPAVSNSRTVAKLVKEIEKLEKFDNDIPRCFWDEVGGGVGFKNRDHYTYYHNLSVEKILAAGKTTADNFAQEEMESYIEATSEISKNPAFAYTEPLKFVVEKKRTVIDEFREDEEIDLKLLIFEEE